MDGMGSEADVPASWPEARAVTMEAMRPAGQGHQAFTA